MEKTKSLEDFPAIRDYVEAQNTLSDFNPNRQSYNGENMQYISSGISNMY